MWSFLFISNHLQASGWELASSRPESDLFGPLSRLIILTFFGGANLFQWFLIGDS